jgi:hypothetical protein
LVPRRLTAESCAAMAGFPRTGLGGAFPVSVSWLGRLLQTEFEHRETGWLVCGSAEQRPLIRPEWRQGAGKLGWHDMARQPVADQAIEDVGREEG